MNDNFNKATKYFTKSYWGACYNPFFLTRKALYKSIELYALNFSGRLLDVGCGTKPYHHLFVM
jgi:hypothetical protein